MYIQLPVALSDFTAQKTEEKSCHLLWSPKQSSLIEWGADLKAVCEQLLPRRLVGERWLV